MTITVDSSFHQALAAYRASYHREIALGEVINKAMAFWVSFAMAKTVAVDPAGITAELSRPARKGERPAQRMLGRAKVVRAPRSGKKRVLKGRAAERQGEWAGTFAAALAQARNYKGIRSKTPAQAYALIERFVRRRLASVGYHKFGFVPALRRLKGGSTGSWGRFQAKNPPGWVMPAENEMNPLAEVTNYARAIAEVQPQVLMEALPEVVALLTKYAEENLARAHAQAFR